MRDLPLGCTYPDKRLYHWVVPTLTRHCTTGLYLPWWGTAPLCYGPFTLADPDSDPYLDSDSCTIQILRERDLDPDLNQCEKFWIILCSHRVWSPNPSPDPAMWISHYTYPDEGLDHLVVPTLMRDCTTWLYLPWWRTVPLGCTYPDERLYHWVVPTWMWDCTYPDVGLYHWDIPTLMRDCTIGTYLPWWETVLLGHI